MTDEFDGRLRRPLPRRRFLQTSAAAAAVLAFGTPAWAEQPERPRLVVVLLRGAVDGLAVAAPVGDPHYAEMRAGLTLEDGIPLDGLFSLNPGMPGFARLFADRQAAIVHAVATPYRNRSHFDGQDVLESGYPERGQTDSGWLNRAIGEAARRGGPQPPALAIGASLPLILRGPAPVTTWINEATTRSSPGTRERLLDLYKQTNPSLAEGLARAVELDATARSDADLKETAARRNGFAEDMRVLAAFLREPSGPSVGVIDSDGWDTHVKEGPQKGRLGRLLAELDQGLLTLRDGLGPVWAQTTVVVVTEFGRTVRMNGTTGTDHGNGTLALLAGGGVAGGKVVADWPGLAPGSLYEGRDLQPTIDTRSIFKAVAERHFGLDGSSLDRVFPSSGSAPPLPRLVT